MTRENQNLARLIRLPVNQTEKLSAYYAFVRDYEANHGEEPSIERAAQEIRVRVDRLRHLLSMSGSIQSLDAERGDSSDGTFAPLEDRIADQDSSPREKLCDLETREVMFRALGMLPERDRMVIVRRYNIDDAGMSTLEMIASELGVTKERVRQIENGALKKLHESMLLAA